MKKVLLPIICIAFMVYWAGAVCADDVCVSNATALQDALDDAEISGESDIIRVVQGTYNGNFNYNSGETYEITLLGGYTSGCLSRILNPENTVLDAAGESDTVIYLYCNGGDIFVEGFTIQNGWSDGQVAGIYAESESSGASGDITIKTNIIKNNTSTTTGMAGVKIESESTSSSSGDIILTENTIMGNTSDSVVSGGGIIIRSISYSGTAGAITLNNNVIVGNTSGSSGGGVIAVSNTTYGSAADINLINNIIAENNASVAAGGLQIWLLDGTGGVPGTLTLTNNTVYKNQSNNLYGGVDIEIASDVSVGIYCRNNIIWGNEAVNGSGKDIYLNGSNGIMYGYNNDYSDMDGSWTVDSNNIDADPLLTGNYHLKSASPCIDSGINTAPGLPSTDIEGDDRIVDGDNDGTDTVDIGADEYVPRGMIAPLMMLFPN